MGTTHSKLKQDNYEWNRNSLEIDGFYVSTRQQHTEENPDSKSSKRKQRSGQGNGASRLNYPATLGENNYWNSNSLETDGGSYVNTHQQLNTTRLLSKVSRQKSKSARSNTKTNREDGNIFDRNTSIEDIKKQVEEKINEAVWRKGSDNLRSRTSQCSLDSTCRTDEVGNETCTSNFQQEINTGTPQEYESRRGNATNSNRAQGSETDTCDVDNTLTNDSPTIEHNDKNDLEEGNPKPENEPSNACQNVTDEAKTYPTYDEFKHELVRFNSYKSYPNDNDKPYTIRLAQGGFFCTGNGDEVMCYVCLGKKADWRADDDPFQVHVKLNQHCQFLKNNAEVNIPMQSSSIIESRIAHAFARVLSRDVVTDNSGTNNNISTNNTSAISTSMSETDLDAKQSTSSSKNLELTSETRSNDCNNTINNNDDFNGTNSVRNSDTNITNNREDNTGRQSPQPLISSGPETQSSAENTQDREVVVKQSSNQGSVRGSQSPKYQKYSLLSARLASFSAGLSLAVPAQHLASAGLFYTGYGDCTRCFMCGIGLRHWSSTDDPWVEHARWSINCGFLLEQKGQQFIDLIKQALDYRQQIDNNVNSDARLTSSENTRPAQDSLFDTLIHQTAAQSILEMGYDSKMVRSAVREILQTQGRDAVTSVNLMEKVFEIEARMDKATVHEAVNKAVPSTGESDKNTDGSSPKLSEKEQRVQLHLQNEMLKQQAICTNCQKNDVSIVYLPCGHLITCDICAPKIKYCQMNTCGKYIMGTVRTYRS